MPVCLILPGKLPPGDPRYQQALACGFKEQLIWTRPEADLPKADIERSLFRCDANQFLVHMGESGPLSVVLSASDECATRLVESGFEAGTALTKWLFADQVPVNQVPHELREISLTASWWGREAV